MIKKRRATALNRELLPYASMEVLDALARLVAVARRQRMWTQGDLAAKAEVGLTTVAKIEKGDPSVAMGYWLKVLWAVDQADRLAKAMAPDQDPAGFHLMLQQLPRRVRVPKLKG